MDSIPIPMVPLIVSELSSTLYLGFVGHTLRAYWVLVSPDPSLQITGSSKVFFWTVTVLGFFCTYILGKTWSQRYFVNIKALLVAIFLLVWSPFQITGLSEIFSGPSMSQAPVKSPFWGCLEGKVSCVILEIFVAVSLLVNPSKCWRFLPWFRSTDPGMRVLFGMPQLPSYFFSFLHCRGGLYGVVHGERRASENIYVSRVLIQYHSRWYIGDELMY